MEVYGVVGMPLSGKSEAGEILRDEGFATLEMGDVVRIEKEERGLEDDEMFVDKMRDRHGEDAIARLSTPYFREVMNGRDKIAIMGMRSLEEKHRFEDELDIEIETVALWASPETREERRKERGRDDDDENLYSRDMREINYGIGDLIARSDYMIENEGSLESLEEEVKQVVG